MRSEEWFNSIFPRIMLNMLNRGWLTDRHEASRVQAAGLLNRLTCLQFRHFLSPCTSLVLDATAAMLCAAVGHRSPYTHEYASC